MADQKVSQLDTIPVVDRAADLLYVVDTSAGTSNKVTPNALLGISGAPVGDTDVATLTNKTLTNPSITVRDNALTIQNNSDNTKQAVFELSGITTGTTRTLTLPDASTTLVGTTATQTLTNKTLTSPTINTATISNPTITADSISEYTEANGVSLDGLNIKDGKLNTANSIVTANYTNASVTADKLSTGAQINLVVNSETTASTTYTDLGTTGPTATVTIGANGLALVILYCQTANNTGTALTYMTYAVSGATTTAAADTNAFVYQAAANNAIAGGSAALLVTGLGAGSTTFTAKYRVSAGTGTWSNRRITVIPL